MSQRMPGLMRLPAAAARQVVAAAAHLLAALFARVRAATFAGRFEKLRAACVAPAFAAPLPTMPGGTASTNSDTSSSTSTQLLPLLRSAAVLVIASLATLAAARGVSSALAPPSHSIRAASIATPAAATPAAAADALTIDEVKTTVLAWMEAKSRAFGPQHDVAALDAVLTGPMLRDWRERAVTHRENDWHWSYEPSNVVVRASTRPPLDSCNATS